MDGCGKDRCWSGASPGCACRPLGVPTTCAGRAPRPGPPDDDHQRGLRVQAVQGAHRIHRVHIRKEHQLAARSLRRGRAPGALFVNTTPARHTRCSCCPKGCTDHAGWHPQSSGTGPSPRSCCTRDCAAFTPQPRPPAAPAPWLLARWTARCAQTAGRARSRRCRWTPRWSAACPSRP